MKRAGKLRADTRRHPRPAVRADAVTRARKLAARTATMLVPFGDIDYIILYLNADKPAVTYWLSDGRASINTFSNKKECARAWAKLNKRFESHSFVRCYNFFFNAERLFALEKLHTEKLGHHLFFRFPRTPGIKLPYADKETLEKDCTRLIELLAIAQDLRAGYEASPTKH